MFRTRASAERITFGTDSLVRSMPEIDSMGGLPSSLEVECALDRTDWADLPKVS